MVEHETKPCFYEMKLINSGNVPSELRNEGDNEFALWKIAIQHETYSETHSEGNTV